MHSYSINFHHINQSCPLSENRETNGYHGPMAIQSQVERLIGRGSFGYVVSACVGPKSRAMVKLQEIPLASLRRSGSKEKQLGKPHKWSNCIQLYTRYRGDRMPLCFFTFQTSTSAFLILFSSHQH